MLLCCCVDICHHLNISPSQHLKPQHHKIDQQTDALISMIGENQVNYRFFIGFKLLLNDQEFSMKSLTVEAKNALSDFQACGSS